MVHSCFDALWVGGLAHWVTCALRFGCCTLCWRFSLCLCWACFFFSTKEMASLLCILPPLLPVFECFLYLRTCLWHLALEVNKLGSGVTSEVLGHFPRGFKPMQNYKVTLSDLPLLFAFFPKMDLPRNKPVLMGGLTLPLCSLIKVYCHRK